jgi:hypothetical protein
VCVDWLSGATPQKTKKPSSGKLGFRVRSHHSAVASKRITIVAAVCRAGSGRCAPPPPLRSTSRAGFPILLTSLSQFSGRPLGSVRFELRERDLNPRPFGYEPNELPGCSTPRCLLYAYQVSCNIQPDSRDPLALPFSRWRRRFGNRATVRATRSIYPNAGSEDRSAWPLSDLASSARGARPVRAGRRSEGLRFRIAAASATTHVPLVGGGDGCLWLGDFIRGLRCDPDDQLIAIHTSAVCAKPAMTELRADLRVASAGPDTERFTRILQTLWGFGEGTVRMPDDDTRTERPLTLPEQRIGRRVVDSE